MKLTISKSAVLWDFRISGSELKKQTKEAQEGSSDKSFGDMSGMNKSAVERRSE